MNAFIIIQKKKKIKKRILWTNESVINRGFLHLINSIDKESIMI